MNRYALFAAALTAALYTAPAAAPAQAADTIRRCEAADGTVGYTNGSCGVFDQKTVAVTTMVVEGDSGDGNLQAASLVPMDRQAGYVGRRSLASGCARSPTQLQMDLRGAFALGDVNRIAESYHWVGVSSGNARTTMDRLQRLASRPVLEAQYYNASIGSAALYAGPGGEADGGGMMQLVLAGDGATGRVVDFDVHRYAGCYFVSF